MKRSIYCLVMLALLGTGAAFAQQAPAKGPNPAQGKAAAFIAQKNVATEAELSDLVKTLEDDEARKKLISRLNALRAAKQGMTAPETKKNMGARVLDILSARLDRLSTEFVNGTRAIMDLPNVYDWVVRQASDTAERDRWIEIIWKIALAVLIGLAGEWVVRRLLAHPRSVLETRQTDSIWVKSVSLLARTVLDVIPIIGFLAGSYAILVVLQPGEMTRNVAITIIYANVLVRAVLAFARLVLAPAAPALRLLPLRDVDANYLFIWTRRFTDVATYGYFSVVAMTTLGLPASGAEIMFKLVALLVTLMIVVFILQNRVTVADWLRGNGDENMLLRGSRNRLADVWHVLMILYAVVLYGVWTLAAQDGFEFVLQASAITLLILIAARLVTVVLRRATQRVFSLKSDVRERYPNLEARANRYLPVLEKAIGVFIGIMAALTILEAWGVDSYGWLDTPLGQRIVSSVITIALLLVATIVVLEVASAMIERYLTRESATISTRARTLLPLLRTTILVVLVTMFILVTLSELGLNIAPLLAGAGVVGLAIGFGAQTLVKDIITGMFILMEDQLAVGDVVKVGSHAGLVETLTLRTIRLRDFGGVVHVVPFSEVTTLENMTKDFSRYVFEVGVAYREDTDAVIAALREVGDELVADDNFKELITVPLEIMGVDSFGDNAVIIKARITTQPIKQWQVGREFNRRMKKRFDELGIEIPFPHRTIYFGEDKEGEAPIARVAMVEKDHGQKDTQPVAPGDTSTGKGSAVPTPDTGRVSTPDAD